MIGMFKKHNEHMDVVPYELFHHDDEGILKLPSNSWAMLCLYAVVRSHRRGWEHDGGRSCFGGLLYGHRVALQLRVPTTVKSPFWDSGVYLRSERFKNETIRRKIIKASQAWFQFVIGSKLSPWRQVMSSTTLFSDADGYTGVLFDDCRVNRALMHNAFIAIRWAWEHPDALLRWHKLYKITDDPVASVFYAQFTTLCDADKKKPPYVLSWRSLNHTWGSSDWSRYLSPSLIAMDNPDLSKVSPSLFNTYQEAYSTVSSNKLWSFNTNQQGHKQLLPLTEFGSKLSLVEKNDPPRFSVSSATVRHYTIPEDVFLDSLPSAILKRRKLEADFLSGKLKAKEVI